MGDVLCRQLHPGIKIEVTVAQFFLFEGVAYSMTSSNLLALDFLWTLGSSAFWTVYSVSFFPIVENQFIII